MDRRIKKTEDAILQATIKLLKDTRINKLSIKEICNEANISRSTFYLHYVDATDVIEQLYNEVSISLSNTLDKFDFSIVISDPIDFLINIFEIVDKYIKEFSILLNAHYHSDFRRRLKKILCNKVLQDNSYRYRNAIEFEYSVDFIMSGLVETICDNITDFLDKNKRLKLLNSLTGLISSGFNVK